MTGISLDLSGKIDPVTKELYRIIDTVTKEVGVSYVLVAAMARDLLLYFVYGADIRRATTDVNIGVEVGSWTTFEHFKAALLNNHFTAAKICRSGTQALYVRIVI